MRNMVERHVRISRGCPSTTLRVVPLPRWGRKTDFAPLKRICIAGGGGSP